MSGRPAFQSCKQRACRVRPTPRSTSRFLFSPCNFSTQACSILLHTPYGRLGPNNSDPSQHCFPPFPVLHGAAGTTGRLQLHPSSAQYSAGPPNGCAEQTAPHMVAGKAEQPMRCQKQTSTHTIKHNRGFLQCLRTHAYVSTAMHAAGLC